jgi:hypothetical protein
VTAEMIRTRIAALSALLEALEPEPDEPIGEDDEILDVVYELRLALAAIEWKLVSLRIRPLGSSRVEPDTVVSGYRNYI